MSSYFNVLNTLDIDVDITKNPYGFQMDDLFALGARINPKRSFLFVSKLIGKHLDVNPDVPKATGYLLANLFYEHYMKQSFEGTEDLVHYLKTGEKNENVGIALTQRYKLNKEKVIFIGFAETATGLGYSVFSAFDDSYYIHTTREELMKESAFDFEEEHSHATDHRCYAFQPEMIERADHIVLVDDEMTTGKTSINLILSMKKRFSAKKFTILSLLDWRNDQEIKEYEIQAERIKSSINVISLTEGRMKLIREKAFEEPDCNLPVMPSDLDFTSISHSFFPTVEVLNHKGDSVSYPFYSARFGSASSMLDHVEESCANLGNLLREHRTSQKTLVLGTGEFMYIPSRVASYMGNGVKHKSTTRSPIFPSQEENYPIVNRMHYVDDDGITYYLYNVSADYEEVFVLFEKHVSNQMKHKLAKGLMSNGVSKVVFVEGERV